MKLAILLGLLLVACTNQAVTYMPQELPCMVQPANSTTWYPCGSNEAKIADCLNLMETAMKAVDPYIDMMSLPEATREKILKLWDRTKQSCWSELKNLQPQHYH